MTRSISRHMRLDPVHEAHGAGDRNIAASREGKPQAQCSRYAKQQGAAGDRGLGRGQSSGSRPSCGPMQGVQPKAKASPSTYAPKDDPPLIPCFQPRLADRGRECGTLPRKCSAERDDDDP